ncbi:MAG: DUF2851 family protein [Bacteroidales bacterium]|nr:DUF2851 family protein [Bacteroidales bacterium]
METLLHYVWKHKLYVPGNFQTIEGLSLEIIDPGIHNPNAGPDFFNAKIKLGDKIWAGNIEMHTQSSDWYKHAHDRDPAYNSVILHVVESIDELDINNSAGRLIPQWIIPIPRKIKENYHFLLHSDYSVPCVGRLWEIPEIYLSDWKASLLMERLENKTTQISFLLKKHKNDWNEVLYIILARNFGFGLNNDSFQRLAEGLPLKYILKHRDSILQTEALFLGQAGLLEESIEENPYYSDLQKEYRFLSVKYKLNNLDSFVFKNLRIRPRNFPHIKIVQLAGQIRRYPNMLSPILEMAQLKEFQSLFNMDMNSYWDTHFKFDKNSVFRPKRLGINTINLLIINTVVPILLAYGKQKNIEKHQDTALRLLEEIKPENNFIVNIFRKQGIIIEHAGDSQAIIQLKREYCDKKKCIFCRIGHKLLSK